MKKIVQKLVSTLIVLMSVTGLCFFMGQFVAGDAAEMMLVQAGIDPTIEEIAMVRQKMGLNDSIVRQYFRWISNISQGDFGVSYRTNSPVIDEFLVRWPHTMLLALTAFGLTAIISVPFGILCALHKDSWLDRLGVLVAVIGSSIPPFVLGLWLLLVFAIRLRWTSISGTQTIVDVILPTITLAISLIPANFRLLRASTLEVLQESYVSVLRSRGIRKHVIVLGHILKNALGPWIANLGTSIGHLMGGTVIVENLFAWPGVGQFVLLSVKSRDYPVILSYILFMGIIFIFIHVLVDAINALIVPHIQKRVY